MESKKLKEHSIKFKKKLQIFPEKYCRNGGERKFANPESINANLSATAQHFQIQADARAGSPENSTQVEAIHVINISENMEKTKENVHLTAMAKLGAGIRTRFLQQAKTSPCFISGNFDHGLIEQI